MGVFNLLLFLILIYPPSLTTQTANENGGIATIDNSTHIPPPAPSYVAAASRTTRFQPGIPIIVAIITTLFSITFLLLLYVKHCRTDAYADDSGGGLPISRGNSGVNKKVIESLPMFRFSSLRGQKDGLECAVCLSRFEPDEVLRLLPKCKHAFHVECVDTWLDEHSTCPLCRYRVDPEDILLVDNSKTLFNHNRGDSITPRSSDHGKGQQHSSPRLFSGRHSSAGERGNPLEIIVENSRGRVSIDNCNSRRKSASENRRSDLRSISLNSWRPFRRKSGTSSENAGDKHRLEHQIIISDGDEGGQRRWSDVQAAEILYLRTEMILEGEEGSGRGVTNERSKSEITGMSRCRSNNGGRERERKKG